ncbi:hypothetical protein [Cohnella luojiensis]|uniref:Uncharacterized protein n=1 Tax=Cohnella luojiensis TaxID=652876 RepID=A0A4Y8M1S7_9BACL|nr:hypothetical protein [Cohnella luojiensis]TFE28115.1 hypothetical protein E2980_07810 [Cohnella luojiensis]
MHKALREEHAEQTVRQHGFINRMLGRKRNSPLTPEHVWHPGLDEKIAALSESQLGEGHPDGLLSARAWKAALHLWNDSLHAAHELVEHLNTPTGAALHGIMHRREGDFDNAKYWFHLAGNHPSFHGLQARAAGFLMQQTIPHGPLRDPLNKIATQGSWNPYLFLNAIAIQENHVREEESRVFLEHLQQLELEAFMRFLEGRITWFVEVID